MMKKMVWSVTTSSCCWTVFVIGVFSTLISHLHRYSIVDAFLVPSLSLSSSPSLSVRRSGNTHSSFVGIDKTVTSPTLPSSPSRLWGSNRSPSDKNEYNDNGIGGGGGNGRDNQNNNSYGGFLMRNKDRTDIRTFLTQRTIQTFVFLLSTCREEASIRWLENVLDFTNIDEFHGTGAFNSTCFSRWDSAFLDMLGRDKEEIVISVVTEDSQRRRRRRGLSGHNSYLESLSKPPKEREVDDQELGARNPYLEETTVEYTFEIDPSSLVRRMISVREQIANEWAHDLDILTQLNDEIMEAYEEYLEEQDQLMEDADEDDEDSIKGQNLETKCRNDDAKEDSSFDDFLSPYSEQNNDGGISFSASASNNGESSESGDTEMKPIFDRNAVFRWSQSLCSLGRDSSHFRRQSFDLLLLLATQESIHRVLRAYKMSDEDQADNSKIFSTGKTTSYEWLLDFYKDRVETYFDGYQDAGKAEAFLEDLLRTPPTIIESATEVVAFIDPSRVAEDIIRERSEVALDWREIIKAVPEDHTDIRRLLFSSLMSKNDPATERVASDMELAMPTQAAIDAVTNEIAKNIMNTTSVGIFE